MIPGKPDQIPDRAVFWHTRDLRSPWSVDCAATTSRSYFRRTCHRNVASFARLGAEIIDSPGAEGSNGRRASRPIAQRRQSRLDVPLPVRQPRQPRSALPAHRTRDPGRRARDHPLRRRSRAPRATLMGVGRYSSRAPDPRCRSGPSSHRPARWLTDWRNLDDGYITDLHDNHGAELLIAGWWFE